MFVTLINNYKFIWYILYLNLQQICKNFFFFSQKILKNVIYIYNFKIGLQFLLFMEILNNKRVRNFLVKNEFFALNKFYIQTPVKFNALFLKGLKRQKLGIYIRNFLKKKNFLKNDWKLWYLIMRFKKKNLFLTLLNTAGNVLCKANIGSFGFKKKVKSTGYAIKRTCKYFSKRILGSFIKTTYYWYKKIKSKYENAREKFRYSLLNLKNINKSFNIEQILNNSKKLYYVVNDKLSLKFKDNIIVTAFVNKLLNYRNYFYLWKSIKKHIQIKLRAKSDLKYWGFKFIMYGLAKRFRWFTGLELRLPIPHSNGLRLKKKRRV